MNQINQFEKDKMLNIKKLGANLDYKKIALDFLNKTAEAKYTYNFSWLGLPIIQLPQDIIAMQEIIWGVKPDLIIETGIAHGGSLIFYASMLELLGGEGKVLGIDIDIRLHNRIAIEKHPMFNRISMIEGSSIEATVVQQVCEFAKGHRSVLVALDSNHTHAHVLRELELYSPLVSKGSYLVVFDTLIDDLPDDFFPDRPWGKDNNPKTAVHEFLQNNDRFVMDKDIGNKLLISVAPDGYLRCVKE